jgi:hypothetical protein
MAVEPWPALPYAEWRDTKETVHRFAQIVGKLRLAASPPRNHWWNVPLYLTGRGVTTSPAYDGEDVFEVRLDYLAHELTVDAAGGRSARFALAGLSVADFYRSLLDALDYLEISVRIAQPRPFDLPDRTPFDQDTAHATYDRDAVTRYWRILLQADRVLKELAGRWRGKASPVHHFWHTFDIATTRFSGRPADLPADADPVTREAYCEECVSFGFWFGDDETFADPAFYSYTHPEPAGLADQPLAGPGARWLERGATHLAVLPYDEVRRAPDPRQTALEFLQSAWEAGAQSPAWGASAARAAQAA